MPLFWANHPLIPHISGSSNVDYRRDFCFAILVVGSHSVATVEKEASR